MEKKLKSSEKMRAYQHARWRDPIIKKRIQVTTKAARERNKAVRKALREAADKAAGYVR